MGKFLGTVKASIKSSIAYRFEMLITVIIAPASILITYFLWKAIFANSSTDIIGGFNFSQLLTYYVFGWIVGIFTWTDIPNNISHNIRHGKISKNLVKPLNFLLYFFYMDIGSRIFAILIEVIPIFIISLIFFKIQVIPFYLPLFIISLGLAFILNFLISTLVGLTAFWFVHNRGVIKLKRVLVHFLSGAVLPITFFPIWFQDVSYFMPFQYLQFVPTNFWLGKYHSLEILNMLFMQFAWVVVFYFLCFIVWKRAIKRVASVGI